MVTLTLRDGRCLLNDDLPCTFSIKGNRLIFEWPQEQTAATLTFKRRANGDIEVKPVLPMDPGDQFVIASEPWRRIGPPVRAVPSPE